MRIGDGRETKVHVYTCISVDGKELEQIGQFCYLGSMITSDANCHLEIRRIAMPYRKESNELA